MSRYYIVAVAFALLYAEPAAAQPAVVKDPAELFPPDTALFLELTQPAAVSDHIAGLLHGSVFDDLPGYMLKKFGDRGDGFMMMQSVLSVFSAFLSPEMLAEVKRFQGGAVAMTGVNKRGSPEIVGVLLAGDSNVPGFIVRMTLTTGGPMIRSAGQIEGVAVYREDSERFLRQPMGADGGPKDAPDSVHFAQMPGIILVGSSKDAVADVIKRIKGKESRLSLAGSPGFKEAASLRARPGLFLYANPVRGAEQMDAAIKTALGGAEPPAWAVIKELLNPKAFQSLTASLTLANSSADLSIHARMQAGQNSPLLSLFADRPMNASTLRTVAKDAAFTLTLPLGDGDGEQRWGRLLAAADAVAKATGSIGASPSELVKEIEANLKVSIGQELFAKIAFITVALPAKQEIPKDGGVLPTIVVVATDEDGAKRVEDAIPALIGLAIGDALEPITETIQGRKVRSLPAAAMPWKTPLHYGREGATLVIGQDRKLVAAALGRQLADSLASEPKIAAVLKNHETAALLACLQWETALSQWLVPSDEPKEKKGATAEDKHLAALLSQVGKLPPLVVSLRSQRGLFRLQVQQVGLKEASAKVIDSAVEFLMNGGFGIRSAIEEGIPAKN